MIGVAAHVGDDLLEREAELARLVECLQEARDGQGCLLCIEGPAGIGKTVLLDAACRMAHESGFVVLKARGGELERQFPHGVVRQLFEAHLRGRAADVRSSLLSGAAELAAPVVAPGSSMAARRIAADPAFAVDHGLYWLTANLADAAPLLLIVDDAHWTDVASLRFILHLARRLEGMAVLVAVAYRSGEPEITETVLSQLVGQPGAELLLPAPLTHDGVARLIAGQLHEEPDPEFAATCHRATGGTPFLVDELVSALRARGVRPLESSIPEVDDIGPQAVARATVRRLESLPAPGADLARAVAVLGADGRLHRAARLAGIVPEQAVAAADALVAVNVLRPGRPLEFVHPIVRAAVYRTLPAAARAAAHARAAELLAEEGAELDAIAGHLLLTEPEGRTEKIERLRDAAEQAVARGAPESAASYLRRALDEGPMDAEHRAELLFELGRAEKLMHPPRAIDHLRAAHQLATDPVLRARIASDLGDALFYLPDWDAAVAVVGTATAELQGRNRELALRLEAFRAGLEFWDVRWLADITRRLPELRAAATADAAGAREMALVLSGAAAWLREPREEVHRLLGMGLDGGRFLAAGGSASWVVAYAIQGLVLTDDLESAVRLADDIVSDAGSRGSISTYALGLMSRAWAYARRGDLVSAEADMRGSLEPMREHHTWLRAGPFWSCVDAIIERSELDDEAASLMALDVDAIPETIVGWPLALEARGRVRLAHGDLTGGVEDLIRCGSTLHARGNPNGWGWRPALALALAPTDSDRALELAEAHLRAARRMALPRGIGIGLRTLGLVEGGAEGLAHLEEGVQVLEGSPARLEYARALVELGAARRRANQRASAREPLRLGLDLAHRCGATRLAGRARAELVATGARPRRAMLTGRDALTATEQRIASMAAEGMSNPQIAQALFVTRKTVENHLARIYGKLGIDSRTRLAEALVSADLMGD